MAIKKLIFFDTETNGVDPKNTSVLSVSAMKITYDTITREMISIGEFDRFYFRKDGEEINYGAIKVNGLTDEEITRRRNQSNTSYPRTFLEDLNSFIEFCDGATHYIAHNIKFDRAFIPFILPYQFDTMFENIDILKLAGRYEGTYKWPKLNECAKYYKVPLDENELHNSMYDVQIMARVFYVMRNYEKTSKRIQEFVDENISTDFRSFDRKF